jgi:nucleotide-binding universal stress UspA family protein
MPFKHLLVAIDDSPASRNAARFAAYLAGFLGDELTVLNVLPAGPGVSPGSDGGSDGVHAMLGREIFATHPSLAIEAAAVRGVPQVEIPRFAEQIKASLIVLGRKPRSRTTRLMLGDTSDAVVRRSRLPCLMVPPGLASMRRLLVALDGTDRGLGVLRTAVELANRTNLELSAVTVEPTNPGQAPMVSARSESLGTKVEETLQRNSATLGGRAVAAASLRVRFGNIVEETTAEVRDVAADILVIGFHPGGPLLEIEEGSVSRSLVHTVPCAVLTVPL